MRFIKALQFIGYGVVGLIGGWYLMFPLAAAFGVTGWALAHSYLLLILWPALSLVSFGALAYLDKRLRSN